MNQPAQVQQQKKTLRRVKMIVLHKRAGMSGAYDSDREYISEDMAALSAAADTVLGPGVWVQWKDRDHLPQFIPISNIARIDFYEREE